MMQIILLNLSGVKQIDIAQKLSLEPMTVNKVVNHPQVKDYIREIAEHKVAEALAVLKTESARLIRKAMQVLEAKLDEGDLEAVKVVIKTISPKDDAVLVGDTTIQVIMPGVKRED